MFSKDMNQRDSSLKIFFSYNTYTLSHFSSGFLTTEEELSMISSSSASFLSFKVDSIAVLVHGLYFIINKRQAELIT